MILARDWNRALRGWLLASLVFVLPAAGSDRGTHPQDCNVQFTWHLDDDGATVVATCAKEETPEDPSDARRPDVPWAAESPGVAGSAYGVGFGILSDWQDDLRNTFVETQSATRRADGGETVATVPGDPDLNNRKFDFEWHLFGPTFQAPVALPEFSLGNTTLYPSLVVEAGIADIDLDFQDRSEPELDNALDGDGPFVGLWFDLTAPLCNDCRWFTGGGLRARFLPEMDVDRSPTFAEPGFEVAEDDVDLQWESYQAFARLGYAFGRVAPYLGIRGQETRIEVDDHLRFTGELDQTLDTQSEFENNSFAALLGLDAHLGGRFFGRAEAGLSDDISVLFKFTYVPGEMTRPEETRSIVGYKFEDLNGNGIWEGNPDTPAIPGDEPPVEGWEITLEGPDGPQRTTTDEEGRFEFTVTRPGTYEVTEDSRDGWSPTTHTSETRVIRLTRNETIAEIHFGNQPTEPEPCASIGEEIGKLRERYQTLSEEMTHEPVPRPTVVVSGPTGHPYCDHSYTTWARGAQVISIHQLMTQVRDLADFCLVQGTCTPDRYQTHIDNLARLSADFLADPRFIAVGRKMPALTDSLLREYHFELEQLQEATRKLERDGPGSGAKKQASKNHVYQLRKTVNQARSYKRLIHQMEQWRRWSQELVSAFEQGTLLPPTTGSGQETAP